VNVAVEPLWARGYLAYERRMPNHRGKATLLRLLVRSAALRGRPFAWRVRSGALMALSPLEGLAPHLTAGWACLREGEWEPHVERCLRELLAPGDVAFDVGANLGYFSAVMAQAVGAGGAVYAFEPTPPAFERLLLCRELNGFAQLHPLPLAVGREDATAELRYDPRLTAMASLHTDVGVSATVTVRTIDGMVAAGELPLPRLLKLDVEGHELAVLEGARETIAAARPAIVFEVNDALSRTAGWRLDDVRGLLEGYRFDVLGESEGYADVLATSE
jgi:FkbM family methyltransferase